ncbi:putative dTDP-4-dehydrorhamnose 3,5-epimerase [Ostertagia ostertagi]
MTEEELKFITEGMLEINAPTPQTKLIRTLEGAIWDVVVDIRPGSATYGQWFGVELSAENKRQFLVPRGFAHGYSVLTETAEIMYKCDNLYDKSTEGGIAYNDPSLNIDWKIDLSKAIVSDKDMMRKIVTTGLLLIAANSVMAQPKNVIMYIGDGFGTSAKTAARMAMGQGTQGKRFTSDAGFHILSLDRLKYAGSATTHSANSWITDSGPGASVYAAGRDGKIDNEAISFNVATGTPVETILEKAKKAGYAVGIVTSTRVTHATPAAFASHIWFRDLEDYIAAQYISSTVAQYQAIYNDPNSKLGGYNAARDWTLPAPKVDVEVDVILGGGSRHFLPRIKTGNRSEILTMPLWCSKAGVRIA